MHVSHPVVRVEVARGTRHQLRSLHHSIGGVFAQRAHSANYYVVSPGNTPENHPPTEACTIHSKQHRGCRVQDPGTRGKHQTKTKNPRCTQQGAVGCRVQDPGTRGSRW